MSIFAGTDTIWPPPGQARRVAALFRVFRQFRLAWMLALLTSPGFHRVLSRTLENRWAFYAALLLKAAGHHRAPIDLHLRSGGTVRVRQFMTLYIFVEVFVEGIYDRALAQEPTVIADVGANTGLFVLRAKERWPDARIIAAEPDPDNIRALRETIALNGLRDVIVIEAAVTAQGGPVTLYRSATNIGGHSTEIRVSASSITVPSLTLEELLPPRCDLLKLDCEGAEVPLLTSLHADRAARIGRIVYETDPATLAEVNLALERHGFVTAVQQSSADQGPTVLAYRSSQAAP